MDYFNEMIEEKNRKHDKLMRWYSYKYTNNAILAELEYDDIYTQARILLREIIIIKRDTLPTGRFQVFMAKRFDNYFKKSLSNRVKHWVIHSYEKRLWNRRDGIPARIYDLDFVPQNNHYDTNLYSLSDLVSNPADNPSRIDLKLDLENKINILSPNSKRILQEILQPTQMTINQAQRQFRKLSARTNSGRVNLKISFGHIRKTLGISLNDFRECRRELQKKLRW